MAFFTGDLHDLIADPRWLEWSNWLALIILSLFFITEVVQWKDYTMSSSPFQDKLTADRHYPAPPYTSDEGNLFNVILLEAVLIKQKD